MKEDKMQNQKDAFEELLQVCVKMGGSDLHLSEGVGPRVRLQGELMPLSTASYTLTVSPEAIATAILHPWQQAVFKQEQMLDMAYALPSRDRFRIHFYREQGKIAMAIRKLESEFRSLGALSLPPKLSELANLKDGLVLITGPTGSGKTTTLATQIHQINMTRNCHIVTVEDPVEYLHQNIKSLIRQRELYTDVQSFSQAVRSALREDPDVLLIGEMRDIDTTRAAIMSAETGHLVFSTLHTGDAVGAIDRMIGIFPAQEQDSIRHQLSMVLRAVVAQRLIPSRNGGDRLPVVEILIVTPAIANLIRTGRSQQIYSAMEIGAAQGMQTMEQAIAMRLNEGTILSEDAYPLARDWQLVEAYLRKKKNADHR
jgi:twitching motility protein PilT